MKKIFGARIRELRGMRKQAETASLLGISPVRLSRLEHGEYEPDLATIVAAAKNFHVSADWLLGLTEERNPHTVNANATASASATSDAARIVDAIVRAIVPQSSPDVSRIEGRLDSIEAALRELDRQRAADMK